jgi:hypothetical protein
MTDVAASVVGEIGIDAVDRTRVVVIELRGKDGTKRLAIARLLPSATRG